MLSKYTHTECFYGDFAHWVELVQCNNDIIFFISTRGVVVFWKSIRNNRGWAIFVVRYIQRVKNRILQLRKIRKVNEPIPSH